MSKKACVLLAPGAEEMEFVISVDVLRRGDVNVIVAGIPNSSTIKCSRQVNIVPDCSLADATSKGPYDVIVLPGGLGGAQALSKSEEVGKLLKEQDSAGRLIAAICAAPTALKAHGIGFGKNITSYPSVELQLTEGKNYTYKHDKVVVDGNIVTSQGPATAFDFALKLVDILQGNKKACDVAKAMLMTY
ncbi:hypothetical protein WA026_011241 [Henosepilachna vigintioctopunctata]|uniref:DJ-1/PfpI domain-containing protein n=1 Tax=Henosepilachna vigintioctopunctata TaxID=420089 RepID=A0AAW1TZP8_9CUCU